MSTARAPVFDLDSQKAKLTSFNPRAELNGDETKPAADIDFECNMPSEDLAMFEPTLRGTLYCKREGIEGGDLANQASRASAEPNLRFPKLKGPFKWETEIVGAKLTIDCGINASSAIVLESCKVKKFSIDPQEGGTCIIRFQVQCHPTEQQSGKLCYLVGTDQEISLEPPGEPETPKRSRRGRATGVDNAMH